MASRTHKTLSIDGMDELTAALSRLEAFAEKDVIKKACRAGAKVVADAAKELAPEKTGRLKNAIRVRMGRVKRGSVSALAAVGKRWFAGDEFYGAFQEFGWKSGRRSRSAEAIARRITRGLRQQARGFRKTGAGLARKGTEKRDQQERYFAEEGRRRAAAMGSDGRKQIPGEHFMEHAFEEKGQQALNAMTETLRAGLEQEAKVRT